MSENIACQNHPTVPAIDRCAGCAEPFCANCMVELFGQRYCGSCKVMAIKDQPMPDMGVYPCKEAQTAFVTAIVGMFLFGIILGPVALSQAHKATQVLDANPQYTGREKVRAARIIGIFALVFGIINCIYAISQQSHSRF